MSDFTNQKFPFVLNSFVKPNTFNYNSSLLMEESSGAPETSFSSNFPDAFFQEIPGQYAQNHGAITLDEANLQVPFKLAGNPSAVAEQASYSTAIPMVVELERRGDHQLLTAEVSDWENKKNKVAETKVEREEKRKNQRKNVRGLEKTKESRLKPGVKNMKKVPEKVQTDNYVHVRARRGEATDKHSLAERVRRKKIGARMKLLQSLVPGCDKITGKTQILDEIISYVQFLQHQVEEFSSLELPLLPYRLESSSSGQLTDFTASTSSLLPQPDRLQRLNITTQDENNKSWGTQYQNPKLADELHGSGGLSASKGES
ncbi:hypothetical protein CRYUN_Cryun25bG0038800 [Craigia yunnanensis]